MRGMRSAAVIAAVAVLGIASVPACQPHGPVGGHGGKGGECTPLAVDGDGTGTSGTDGSAAPAGAPAVADDTVHVDLAHTPGPANRDLTGVVWNSGASIEPLAAAHPTTVRIDASRRAAAPGLASSTSSRCSTRWRRSGRSAPSRWC
jgi:hypothetical protein